MSHTWNSTTAQLQLLCNHTQIMEHVTQNYGTPLLLFKLLNTNVLFQNMGHLLIQIMGHYELLLKLWDTSKTMAHAVKVMSILTCTGRVIFPQQKSVQYTKSPIIW